MTELKTMVMPDADDIRIRLIPVLEELHAREKLIPLVVRFAGLRLDGKSVVNMLVLVVYEYTEGAPLLTGKVMLRAKLRSMATALIDDDQVKADALLVVAEIEAQPLA